MTKDEYIEELELRHFNIPYPSENDEDYDKGILNALSLAKELDETTPKKVRVPQFVADWIEEYATYGFKDKLSTIYWLVENLSDDDEHFDWLSSVEHQCLILNTVSNGYVVEEEENG